MSESAYLKQQMENHLDEPEYINDLRLLRRFIQNGSFGYRQSDDIVFQRLKRVIQKHTMLLAESAS